jgi:hypothetical protein
LNINDVSEYSTSHSHSRSHIHLPQLAALNRHYEPVGVLESQTYTDLEVGFQSSLNEKPAHYEDMVLMVGQSCADLLGECERGVSIIIKWFESVNSDRLYSRLWKKASKAAERKDLSVSIELAIESLQREIDRFNNEKRLQVLEPHLRWFSLSKHRDRQPSYRLLFSSFFYQFHLNEFATSLHSLLVELRDNDTTYPLPRWWVPSFKVFSKWLAKGGEHQSKASNEDLAGEDQDPEHIPHITDPENEEPIQVSPRNADAGPPSNIGHLLGRALVGVFKLLGRPDIFFAIKAGIVTVLVSLPSYFKSSTGWFYSNRGIWAVIMTALTIAQFTADTVFGFVVRVVGTLLGAVLGMLVWYIGSGNGTGNAFGIMATLAVLLPFVMFVRINFVSSIFNIANRQIYISPMPAIILCMTICIIIGYSWQDTHYPYAVPSILGYGWDVAWRRFITVVAGITCGLIGSLLPKPVSGRSMIRATCSRTITEMGQLHSELQDYASRRLHSAPGTHGNPDDAIPLRQVAIQAKLNATKLQIAIQKFEPPLQGPWPRALYSDLVALQVELIDLYGSFHSLLQQLEPEWIEAMLTRSGWLDVHFVADHFAVIYMCATALKTGNALPQVTPSPLVDRFYTRLEGLRMPKIDRSGIAKDIDPETLQDWQYALYAIGCTISFAICYVRVNLFPTNNSDWIG